MILDKFIYHKIRELSQLCVCELSQFWHFTVSERDGQTKRASKFTPWHIFKSPRTTHRSFLLLPWGPGFERRVSGLLTRAFIHWALWLIQKCSNSPPFQAILLMSWWNRRPLTCSWSNNLLQNSYFCLKKLF